MYWVGKFILNKEEDGENPSSSLLFITHLKQCRSEYIHSGQAPPFYAK